MAKFIITTDSSCDATLDELTQKNVAVIPFHYCDDKTSYLDDMDIISHKRFYLDMKNGIAFKTSQLNPQEYYDFFKPLTKQKLPILHVSLGSGVSNTINSVFMAKSLLQEEDQSVDIRPIDSKLASAGLMLLIDKLIEFQNQEMSGNEAMEKIQYYIEHLNTFYTTDTLTYFARGGRLSKVEALIGNVLKINPILDCNPSGNLRIVEKTRGSQKAINRLIARVKSQVLDPASQIIYLCHADNESKALLLAKRLVQEVGFKDFKIYFMGPIIGAHTGPGLLSVYFFGKPRDKEVKFLKKE